LPPAELVQVAVAVPSKVSSMVLPRTVVRVTVPVGQASRQRITLTVVDRLASPRALDQAPSIATQLASQVAV